MRLVCWVRLPGLCNEFRNRNLAVDDEAAEGPRLHSEIGTRFPARERVRDGDPFLGVETAHLLRPICRIPEYGSLGSSHELVLRATWSIDSRPNVKAHISSAPFLRVRSFLQNSS